MPPEGSHATVTPSEAKDASTVRGASGRGSSDTTAAGLGGPERPRALNATATYVRCRRGGGGGVAGVATTGCRPGRGASGTGTKLVGLQPILHRHEVALDRHRPDRAAAEHRAAAGAANPAVPGGSAGVTFSAATSEAPSSRRFGGRGSVVVTAYTSIRAHVRRPGRVEVLRRHGERQEHVVSEAAGVHRADGLGIAYVRRERRALLAAAEGRGQNPAEDQHPHLVRA